MTLGQKFQAWLKESMTLFKREYAATMAFVFAMGAVLGGFVFSPGTGIPNPREGGDAADWLAAFGTWAVGYMAWRIAAQSHRHHIQERADAHRKEEKEIAMRRTLIVSRALTGKNVYAATAYATEDKSKLNRQVAAAFLRVVLGVLETVKWSEESKSLLSIPELKALADVEDALLRTEMSAREMQMAMPQGEIPLTEAELRWLDDIDEFAAQIPVLVDKFLAEMNKKAAKQRTNSSSIH